MTTVREYEELVGRRRDSVIVFRHIEDPLLTTHPARWAWECDGCGGNDFADQLPEAHTSARWHASDCTELIRERGYWYADVLTATNELPPPEPVITFASGLRIVADDRVPFDHAGVILSGEFIEKVKAQANAHQFEPDTITLTRPASPADQPLIDLIRVHTDPWVDAPAGERWEAANGWVVITPADPPNRTHEAVMQRPKSGGPWLTTPYVTASLVRLLCTPVPS